MSSSAAVAPALHRAVADDAPGVVELAMDAVRVGPSRRERGVDWAHVAALAEVVDRWSPIVVHRRDGSVIDGQHRVEAARQLGLATIPAVLFEGSAEDAYAEFVRRNVAHGLPLTLKERRVAARRIIGQHPEHSDRRIAEVCGVSPKTVARLRAVSPPRGRRAAAAGADERRVGRDGRARPLDRRGVRARIEEEISRRPDASLRAIAGTVGASPETVRRVRNELREGAVLAPVVPIDPVPEAAAQSVVSLKERIGTRLRSDRAFTDRDGGEAFVDWFEAGTVDDDDLWPYVGVVPLSRVYDIADEARRRARCWTQFAEALEGRVRRRA